MTRPTRAQLAYALSEMYGLAQELNARYANDTQPNRAEAMAAIMSRADERAKILHRMPLDEIMSGKS